jgi:hypothetical protein
MVLVISSKINSHRVFAVIMLTDSRTFSPPERLIIFNLMNFHLAPVNVLSFLPYLTRNLLDAGVKSGLSMRVRGVILSFKIPAFTTSLG